MTQEIYRSCMAKNMGGGRLKGLSKENRRISFCVIAKKCSKGMDEKEALAICSLPKEPKPKNPGNPSRRGKFCTLRDLEAVTTCTVENIDLSTLTRENIHEVFARALEKCSGGKAVAVKKAKKSIEDFSPQEIEVLKTIALLSKEGEARVW